MQWAFEETELPGADLARKRLAICMTYAVSRRTAPPLKTWRLCLEGTASGAERANGADDKLSRKLVAEGAIQCNPAETEIQNQAQRKSPPQSTNTSRLHGEWGEISVDF